MKKSFLTVVIAITMLSCLLTSCSTSIDIDVREPNEFALNEDTEEIQVFSWIYCIDKIPYTSVKELADASDLIVHVEFISGASVVDTSQAPVELMLDGELFTIYDVYTLYELRVVETIKGTVSKGDVITVRTLGGLYENTLVTDQYSEQLTKDYEYILFLTNSKASSTFYDLTDMAQGYLPIKDGKLSLNTKIVEISLFTNGQSAESVISEIKRRKSSQEELAEKKAAEELLMAQHSVRWSVMRGGIAFYEDGYTGELERYDNYSRIKSFIWDITVTGKLNGTPKDQIYHVGIFAPPDYPDLMLYGYPYFGPYNPNSDPKDDVLYFTTTLTDSALLYNGVWYTYNSGSYFAGLKISDLFNEIRG